MTIKVLDEKLKVIKTFDSTLDGVVIEIRGDRPMEYRASPAFRLDRALTRCIPEHIDILLDARNYLYPIEGVDDANRS